MYFLFSYIAKTINIYCSDVT